MDSPWFFLLVAVVGFGAALVTKSVTGKYVWLIVAFLAVVPDDVLNQAWRGHAWWVERSMLYWAYMLQRSGIWFGAGVLIALFIEMTRSKGS